MMSQSLDGNLISPIMICPRLITILNDYTHENYRHQAPLTRSRSTRIKFPSKARCPGDLGHARNFLIRDDGIIIEQAFL